MTRWLLRLSGLAIVVGFAGVLFVWSGVYSVAATKGHFPMVRWLLNYAMQRSVATHAMALETPRLDDPAMLRLAAGHFATGCAICHGAPGVAPQKLAGQMMPPPPYLGETIWDLEAKELFWIVRHGLKYTGMPGWPAPERTDEVWAMAAFLVALPDMSAERYRDLADGEATGLRNVAGGESVGAAAGPPASCVRCHGHDGRGNPDGAFPRLDIQGPAYLARALRDYAAGVRPSGIMEPMAHGLSDAEIDDLAAAYARTSAAGGGTRGAGEKEMADAEIVALGAAIARGSGGSAIPACGSCHGLAEGPANPAYPALAGQYPSYIAGQLQLWKKGIRGRGDYAGIMAPIARMLDDAQIEAVSAYYASLERQTETANRDLLRPTGDSSR